MAKAQDRYVCQACGAVQSKWSGRCEACGAWNSIVEEKPLSAAGPGKKTLGNARGTAIELTDLSTKDDPPSRTVSGVNELDRVLGGGLVDASAILLGGDPGIYSARWAETPDGRDFGHAMRTVWEKLEAAGAPEPRKAAFICALTLAWPGGHDETFVGRCEGRLVWPPRGDRGFGYDPVFLPLDGSLTFGEMDPDAKHAISHRADAFKQLVDACF